MLDGSARSKRDTEIVFRLRAASAVRCDGSPRRLHCTAKKPIRCSLKIGWLLSAERARDAIELAGS